MLLSNPQVNRYVADVDQYRKHARITSPEKSAQDICLELKRETCLMLCGEISVEQFRRKRKALMKAFNDLGLSKREQWERLW